MRGGLILAMACAVALAGCGAPAPAPSRNQARPAGSGDIGGLNQILASGEKASANVQVQVSGPAPTTPAPAGNVDASSAADSGSAQRAAIMDAVRPAIERELATPVEFVVQRVGVQDGWALLIANPQRPGGGAIPVPARFNDDMHDGITVNAILRFSGGGWTLVDHAIGPTDVWYCGVDGPPRSLTGC